jgi:hypothetical protein
MTDPLRDAVEEGVSAMQAALYEQARELVRELLQAGEEAGRDGLRTLEALARVGQLYAAGGIDATSARIASVNYVEAIKLGAYALENEAAVLAWARGVKLLETFARVAFAVLEIALQAAVPGLGVFLSGVVERVVGPKP